jgi:hypothetical protein
VFMLKVVLYFIYLFVYLIGISKVFFVNNISIFLLNVIFYYFFI